MLFYIVNVRSCHLTFHLIFNLYYNFRYNGLFICFLLSSYHIMLVYHNIFLMIYYRND